MRFYEVEYLKVTNEENLKKFIHVIQATSLKLIKIFAEKKTQFR